VCMFGACKLGLHQSYCNKYPQRERASERQHERAGAQMGARALSITDAVIQPRDSRTDAYTHTHTHKHTHTHTHSILPGPRLSFHG
jgi:hypothetical protein